jgi:ribosomal protein S18 acetylase RimI-like enzyme
MARDELVRLEAIAFRSWPAASVTNHRGMLLRLTGGESRRANSAAVYACEPSLGVDEIVATGEAFYRAHGQRTLFQLGPTAPTGLDALLASHGHAIEAPVHVQTAPLRNLVERARERASEERASRATTVSDKPDEAWTDIEIARGRYAGIATTFLEVLARLGPKAGFATALVDGRAAAACLLVHDEDVVVVAAMRTLPEARRRGAARALLHAGALWAAERGATLALLQVEHDNVAALALYADEGFETRYEYHYRAGGGR